MTDQAQTRSVEDIPASRATRRAARGTRRRLVGAAALVGVVAVGGGTWALTHGDSSGTASSASIDHPQGTVAQVPALGAKAVNVREDVHMTQCTLTKGKAVAKGTVTNTEKSARDLVIAAQWLPNASGDTIGLGVWSAKAVPAGKTVNWTATATLPIASDRCILLAQSAPIGSLK